MKKIVIILPCYNEEEVIRESKFIILNKFNDLVQKNLISSESKICFVNDGSRDKTWEIIESFTDNEIIGIKLSRNAGHQFALIAGLESLQNSFDAYITMDVDLQDDIDSLDLMIQEFHNGNDVVLGVRNDRSTDTYFKRKTAEVFYSVMKKMGGAKMVNNHADYRLLSNRALNELLRYSETHLYLRGIVTLVGFNQAIVYYQRKERTLGETKYPFRKSLSLAWEGITSFSNKPLKLVTTIGIIAVVIAVILFVWTLLQLLLGKTITGWTSIVILIIFFGGIQVISLGIIGEYVGKIYMQTKNRPRYGIDKIKNFEK